MLSGLLLATYVAGNQSTSDSRTMKVGGAGTFLAYFAVGCPVCNKLALVALGYSGALQYFAPIQPYLAALSQLHFFSMPLEREFSTKEAVELISRIQLDSRLNIFF